MDYEQLKVFLNRFTSHIYIIILNNSHLFIFDVCNERDFTEFLSDYEI